MELAEACRRAEYRAVGAPVGILDQAASLLGRAGHAVLLDCGTLEYRLVPMPAEAALVIVDSGVEHSHETSGYAQRRAELEAGMESRVRHVRTENERVRAFVDALDRDDLVEAGRLLVQSHVSLRDDYEVSTPELDRLVERACGAGAFGARLVGGGFGGSILALTDRAHADELLERMGESTIAFASGGAEIRW
jgi:galactokinase